MQKHQAPGTDRQCSALSDRWRARRANPAPDGGALRREIASGQAGRPNRRRHRGRTLPGTRARFAALCYMATQPMTTAPAPTPAVIHTMLADGQPVCLRRITPADGALMRAGIEQMSPQSRYMRFFSGMRTPPDWLVERLLDVDGDQHLAWGAIASGAPAGAHPPCDTPRCEGPAIGAVQASAACSPRRCCWKPARKASPPSTSTP